jgi:hypothetical protein
VVLYVDKLTRLESKINAGSVFFVTGRSLGVVSQRAHLVDLSSTINRTGTIKHMTPKNQFTRGTAKATKRRRANGPSNGGKPGQIRGLGRSKGIVDGQMETLTNRVALRIVRRGRKKLDAVASTKLAEFLGKKLTALITNDNFGTRVPTRPISVKCFRNSFASDFRSI